MPNSIRGQVTYTPFQPLSLRLTGNRALKIPTWVESGEMRESKLLSVLKIDKVLLTP